MSFMEGDMINIIGEKASDGWQYGLNTKTGKYGTLLEIFQNASTKLKIKLKIQKM